MLNLPENLELPVKLGKEPLIEVLCAATFTSSHSTNTTVDNLLLGILLTNLNLKEPNIEPLGANKLPAAILEKDPMLQRIPLWKIMVDDNHYVLIGLSWVAVGCLMPYSGWNEFKKRIEQIFKIICDADFINEITNYSIKYVDFIKHKDIDRKFFPTVFSFLSVEISILEKNIGNENVHFRTEIEKGKYLHAISIITNAKLAQESDVENSSDGIVVDIDTHFPTTITKNEFSENVGAILDDIHFENKKVFFSLISKEGIKMLEPIYD